MLGMGTIAASGTAIALPALATTPPASPAWRPVLEPQDAWMDKPGTRHRMIFDTVSIAGIDAAVFYADNFYTANKSGYGLEPAALGVMIVMRHLSTPFGYTDAIWVKYGAMFADKLKLEGEQAVRAPRGNPLWSVAVGPPARSGATPPGKPGDEPVTLATLAVKGTRFAVCGTATRGMAGQLAKAGGGSAKTIEDELRAGLIPGGVIVPAGIVAVNRAQEHGYAFVNIAE